MNSSIYSFISKYFKANCLPAKLKQLRNVLHAPVCWCTLMVQHRDKQKNSGVISNQTYATFMDYL